MKKTILLLGMLSVGYAHTQSTPNYGHQGRVGINTTTPLATMHIEKRQVANDDKRAQGVIFPYITTAERDAFTGLVKGTMIYNTDLNCIDLYDGTQWSCITTKATAGNSGSGAPGSGTPTPGTGTGTQAPNTGAVVLANKTHYISSIKDNEYIPFVKPTQPATWETGETNGNDPLIDVQGTITTQGIDVLIPITGTGTVGAYYQEVPVTAEKSKNNQAGVLILEWREQTINSNTTHITAKLKAKNSNFQIKQLDLAKGLGSDYKGLELANFTYKIDAGNSNTANFTVRAISGIPDKKLGVQTNNRYEHDFIYLPIQGPDGKTWLNNNLGAEYANITSPYFNPVRQAGALDAAGQPLTNPTANQIKQDFRAYGYLYEFGRDSDGHEVVKWTNSTSGTFANPSLHNYNYSGTNNPAPNRMGDPCPSGFHTPTEPELRALHGAILGTTPPSGTTSSSSPKMWQETGLKLPAAGYRYDYSATLDYQGSNAWYWSSTESSSTSAWHLHFYSSSSRLSSDTRTYGHSVRCIAD